jgi:hypothetical protein
MVRLALLAFYTLLFVSPAWSSDVFDRHTATVIKQLIEKGEPLQDFDLAASAKLKPLSSSVSSPCLLIKTDEGNFAKVLLSWGLKKGNGKPIQVLLIERYSTYRHDRLDLTSAHGKDVMLFPGFAFNFDIGQVVPQGQGADIEFTAEAILKSIGEARLFPLNGSQLPAADPAARHDPQSHEGVTPEDFSGVWILNADGRWLGEWDLKLTGAGRATGTFVSDESRNSYDLSGQVAALPHNLKLDVFLANTQMTVDAYLWTKDKSMMAGTVTLTGRKFGFVATRAPTGK